MANTLLLDRSAWDLCIDASRNIAMAGETYSLAQDAASAIRLFIGEYWYDTTLGIPYFQNVLGKTPSVNYLKTLFVNAAETVPDVKSATVYLTSITNGQVSGQVQVTDSNGNISIASF
jgi:hypothetical protein